ncbi:MAG: hypothetical protein RJB62_581 [Pseudomonadota bacterium]|jgi:hypothetical protein
MSDIGYDDYEPTLPPELNTALEEYRVWADVHANASERENSVTYPLYHYTTARGLAGIIESQKIWFTDYRHLNDPSELVHGLNTAIETAKVLSEGQDARIQDLFKAFSNMLRLEHFEEYFDFYIASFSRVRDDLGQWRAYADNGKGFAIGFSAELFSISDKRPDDKPPEFVSPVVYGDSAISERHALALSKMRGIFQDILNSGVDLSSLEVRMEFVGALIKRVIASPIIFNCLTSKHPAYEHESEVRLLIVGALGAFMPYVTTRLRGSEIIPYIPQPMLVQSRGAITEIVVGPAAPPGTERDLGIMLKRFGLEYEVEIKRSEIPYRS